jgi:hypothetical protein
MNIKELERVQDMSRVNSGDHTKETGFKVCIIGVYNKEGLYKPIHASYEVESENIKFRFLLDGSWLQEKKTEQHPDPKLLRICSEWLDKEPTSNTARVLGFKTNRHHVIDLWFNENPEWVGSATKRITRLQVLSDWGIDPIAGVDDNEDYN